MPSYRLTELALDDIDAIHLYLEREAGEATALRIRAELFAKFASLAAFPGQGHSRSELTSLPFLFFTLDPYLIVYQRGISPIVIHAIFHGARDIKHHLKRRTI